jgi:hypothetical protein
VPQACGVRQAFPLADRRPVRVQRAVCVVTRYRNRHFHHPVVAPLPHREPGVGENPQHRGVLGERLGDESLDAVVPGTGDQVLQQ